MTNFQIGETMVDKVYRNKLLAQIRESAIFAYLVWTAIFVGKAFGMTSQNPIYVALVAPTLVFAMVHLMMQHRSKKEFAATLVMYGLGCLSWILSGNASFFLAVIVISLLKDIDLNNLFTYTIVVFGAIAFLRLILASVGFLDPEPQYFFSRGETRYGLGFGQPNSAQSVATFLVALACVLKLPKKKKMVLIACALCLSLYVYRYTLSRTGMMVTIALCIGFLLPENFKKRFFPKLTCLQIVFPVLAFLLALGYSSYLSGLGLGTFGSRFLTGEKLLSGGYLSLFGGVCPSSDLGYVMFACESGLVPLVILSFLNWRCARLLAKHKLWDELLVITCYGFFCFMEAYCSTISLNLGLFMLPIFLYEKTRLRYLTVAGRSGQ